MKCVGPILLISVLTVAGCAKEKQAVPSLPAPNTWVLDGKTFTKAASKWVQQDTLNVLYFGVNYNYTYMLYLTFLRKPTGSKAYKIVYSPKSDDEVSIQEWQFNQGYGGSQDNTNQYLQVTEANGVFTYSVISFPIEYYSFVLESTGTCAINVTE